MSSIATQDAAALDLDGLALWLVERGMAGVELKEQVAGFCQRVHAAGFPLKRTQMGLDTLHPRFGSHTFVWRPGDAGVEHTPRERVLVTHDIYLSSPVHYMRSRGILTLRRRLAPGQETEFPILAELCADGMTDYVAHIVPYDPSVLEDHVGESPRLGEELDGIFFSCATDHRDGFDDRQLEQVLQALPYLALAMKSRLTYDVATTTIGTYLGEDAGHQVLTGKIERGSVEAIRAVIWFSDLRGFTSLSDTLPREILIEVLNDYLEEMARPVHDNHGQVLKFMGDGLLAIFDLTSRNEAEVCGNALKAAAQMRAGFPALRQTRQAAGKPVMEFGLALHVGEVFYGNIGAVDRLDFTVIGPAVNEASRMEALCHSTGQNVLISRAFRDAGVDGGSAFTSVGFHTLKGVREPQELFALAT